MATQQVHEPAREGYFFMCVSRVLFIHLGVSNFPTHPRSPEPHTKRITDGFPPPPETGLYSTMLSVRLG